MHSLVTPLWLRLRRAGLNFSFNINDELVAQGFAEYHEY
jgi:hypothetical protein